MTGKKVLITNDDGPKSPLIAPFLRAVQKTEWCAELRAVLPAEEQSWIGQALTRYRPVFASETELAGIPAYLVSGTPADCACLGADHLYADRPELVVAGINLGANAGLAFFLNSGTVGAARHAFLLGLKAVALSVQVPHEIFSSWALQDTALLDRYEAAWNSLAGIATRLTERLLAADAWQYADYFSINIPFTADAATPAVLAVLAESYYLPLFKERSTRHFVHSFQGFRPQQREEGPKRHGQLPTDLFVLGLNRIAVTPVWHTDWRNTEESLCALKKIFPDLVEDAAG